MLAVELATVAVASVAALDWLDVAVVASVADGPDCNAETNDCRSFMRLEASALSELAEEVASVVLVVEPKSCGGGATPAVPFVAATGASPDPPALKIGCSCARKPFSADRNDERPGPPPVAAMLSGVALAPSVWPEAAAWASLSLVWLAFCCAALCAAQSSQADEEPDVALTDTLLSNWS